MTYSFNFRHEVSVEPALRFAYRGAVSSPIRVFHLSDFDIDSEQFLGRLSPTFHNLPLDPYDPALAAEKFVKTHDPNLYVEHEAAWLRYWANLAELQYTNPLAGPQFWTQHIGNADLATRIESIRPHRRRSSFQYLAAPLESARDKWLLREVGTPSFAQAVSDVRARPRRFASAKPEVYRDVDVLALIAIACQVVRQTASVLPAGMRVTLHQMLTYADQPSGREPAPEGTHQDGSPFILSALVVERTNVAGGLSRVYYNKNRGLALEYELPPGYGLLQSDTHHQYWHEVTTIYPVNPNQPAYRSILGLDIDFVASRHNT
jgi:hypothetical protein